MDRKDYNTAINHISKAIDLNPELVSDLAPLIKEFKEIINKIENKLSNKFENR